MTHRFVLSATYDSYLNDPFATGSVEGRAEDERERQLLLVDFPYSVLLQLAYPEMDYANRWCWEQFGAMHGVCHDASSEYPVCHLRDAHSHRGNWLSHWLAKTDYNFGYNAWYFEKMEDHARFMEFIPQINCGEKFLKER